jgi:hypothetical protein
MQLTNWLLERIEWIFTGKHHAFVYGFTAPSFIRRYMGNRCVHNIASCKTLNHCVRRSNGASQAIIAINALHNLIRRQGFAGACVY